MNSNSSDNSQYLVSFSVKIIYIGLSLCSLNSTSRISLFASLGLHYQLDSFILFVMVMLPS